jgi:transposase-like protein
MDIVAGIASLLQYKELIKNEPEVLCPDSCPFCGKSGLWLHGCYPRKADRENTGEGSLNPILIQRYYCPDCHRTCSVLPECLPSRRWYLWETQQSVLLHSLAGKSLRSIASSVTPSRYTIKRWISQFQKNFHLHKDALCNHFIELGRTVNFYDFWSEGLKEFSLAKAMRLCHASGVRVP